MRHVSSVTTRHGVKLAVERAGQRGRPTVVLLHGGGQTRHSWRTTMDAFAGEGYVVISYDARGHGNSDWASDGDYRFSTLSTDLQDILATENGPFALVGASMGGMTAYHAAGSSQLAIAALVLVDIVPRPARAGRERIIAFMSGHRDGFATVGEAADAVSAYYPQRPRPRDVSGLRKNLREGAGGRLYWHWDPRLYDNATQPEPPRPETWAQALAPNITVPVLLVRGGRSDIVDDAGVEHLRRLLPQTEVLAIPAAGHLLVRDQNDAFNAGVLDFVRVHMPALA